MIKLLPCNEAEGVNKVQKLAEVICVSKMQHLKGDKVTSYLDLDNISIPAVHRSYLNNQLVDKTSCTFRQKSKGQTEMG